MLINKLNILKNFLFLFVIFLFFCMIFVKCSVFNLKKNMKDIQAQIFSIEEEKDILDLELAYLTNPERLKKLYAKVQYMESGICESDNCLNLLSLSQIKDIKKLIPYYFSRIERYSKDESMAIK